MEDAGGSGNGGGKRCRDDSADFTQPKRPRVSPNLIFDILDDAGAESGGLADVIKSLEEEVTATPELNGPPPPLPPPPQVDLGYLLEASDDELGLPPAAGSLSSAPAIDVGDEVEIVGAEWGFGHVLWGFEDEGLGPYEGLEFGIVENDRGIFGNRDYLYDDSCSLFDSSGLVSGPLDYDNLTWQAESLPSVDGWN